jgi:hypothetical protein
MGDITAAPAPHSVSLSPQHSTWMATSIWEAGAPAVLALQSYRKKSSVAWCHVPIFSCLFAGGRKKKCEIHVSFFSTADFLKNYF